MTLTSAHIDGLIAAVRAAAKAEIMPRFRNLDAGMIDAKSAVDDLVTVADTRAEASITKSVQDLLPDALVVGEEAVASNPSLLDLIEEADLAVIIDPIDGTWNFANGLSTFGVILAVTRQGETVFGLLYDPVLDDWILAEKGSGAWYCRPDGTRRRLNSGTPQSLLAGFMPFNLFPTSVKDRLYPALERIDRFTSVKCSCHEYRTVAQGGIGFVVGASLMPWDHAAGALIVTEAGGVVGKFGGTPYRPGSTEGRLLTAANADIFAEVSDILTPVFSPGSA